MQTNPEKGFSGTPKDSVGPGHYNAKALNEIWRTKGRAWDRSQRKNMLAEPTSTSKALGPGAYTPSVSPFNGRMRPSAVFQSGTKRVSYIPSFGKQQTLPDESLSEESTEDAVPGPGTYCGPDALSSFRLHSVPDKLQFFGSRVNRFRLKLPGNPAIGPGTYTPPPASKRSASSKAPFATSDARFQGKEEENPGPGSYRAGQLVEEIHRKMWGKKGIFGTTEKRFVKSVNRTPGPGYYPSEDLLGMHNSAVHKPLSVFQSRIKRELPSKKDIPAPGQYDLPSSFDRKPQPKRGRSQLAVLQEASEAGFSARSPRFPTDSHSEERIGPGRYTPKPIQELRAVNRKNRVLPQVRHIGRRSALDAGKSLHCLVQGRTMKTQANGTNEATTCYFPSMCSTKMLFPLLLLPLALAEDCPVVTCEDMQDNTCALTYGNTIRLRAHHCATTTFCNLTYVLSANGDQTIPCESFNDSGTIYDDNDYRDCGVRADKRNLASGVYPKACATDADCLLQDGTFNPCACGLNGKAYCIPDLSSKLFNQYWKKCNETSNTVYRNDYYYWTWYLEYYSLIVSAPSCAWSVGIELLTFRYLDAFLYQGAAQAIALCIWVVLG